MDLLVSILVSFMTIEKISLSFICLFVGVLIISWLKFPNLIKGKKTHLKQFNYGEHIWKQFKSWWTYLELKISPNQFYGHFILRIINSNLV